MTLQEYSMTDTQCQLNLLKEGSGLREERISQQGGWTDREREKIKRNRETEQ